MLGTLEVWLALKAVETDRTSKIDGLPYEVYLRLLPMFLPLLVAIYNNWMKQGTIPQHFTRGIVKLLCKKKKMVGMGLAIFAL